MRCYGVQILLASLLARCGAHIVLGVLDGYPNILHNFHEGPPLPNPLVAPPPHFPHFLPSPIHPHPRPPLSYRVPQQAILVHVPLRGVFPPFIERIVQRIQTYWSIYNPPELLTRPPLGVPPTTKSPRKKTTTTPAPQGEDTTTEARVTETSGGAEVADTTGTSTEDSATKQVSTLAVFEVTPSPANAENPEGSTTEGSVSGPPDLEADTEEPIFITPERASLLGQKDAFLKFLQTGKVPPHLESDRFNEMGDVFN